MDNNASERAIRGFCIGKKNWEMIDTINGAASSAIIYSIAETAKANNLKPYEYFEYLLTQIPEHMDDTDRSFLEGSFFHGHQSCQNTSENKKTVVSGLLKVKVHGLERLRWSVYIILHILIMLKAKSRIYSINTSYFYINNILIFNKHLNKFILAAIFLLIFIKYIFYCYLPHFKNQIS